MSVDLCAFEVLLQQLPEFGNVYTSPVVGMRPFVRGGEDEYPVMLEDSPGFSHQTIRLLQVFDYPQGHNYVELILGIRKFENIDFLEGRVRRAVSRQSSVYGFLRAGQTHSGRRRFGEQLRAVAHLFPTDIGHDLPFDVSLGEPVASQSLVSSL